jgi:predicted TIM-barrel fold metal-dependent hydrolase
MLVDCHVHTWRYPDHFNREAMLRNQPERRRAWPDEKFKQMLDQPIDAYLSQMEGLIDRAILVGQSARNTSGVDVPNEYLAQVARQYADRLSWCCCVDPTEPGAADEVEKCVKEWGAVGVGELNPIQWAAYANDPRTYPVYEVCQALDVPIVLHVGGTSHMDTHVRMKYGDVLAVDDVAIDFPHLRIVICHLGYPKYEDASFLVQKHENVFADISYLPSVSGLERTIISRHLPVVSFPYLHYAYPLLYCLSQVYGGADKLIFGTDWGVCQPRQTIEVLRGINEYLRRYDLPEIPEATIDNILYENWKKVFTHIA